MATFKYQVQQGDNPASIADRFKLQPQDLFQSNQNAFPLDVGQTITIPGPLTRPNIGSRLASPRGPYGGGLLGGLSRAIAPGRSAVAPTVVPGGPTSLQDMFARNAAIQNQRYGPTPVPATQQQYQYRAGAPSVGTQGNYSAPTVDRGNADPVTGFSKAVGNSNFQFQVLDAQGNDTGRRIGAVSTQSDLRNIAASQGMSEAQFASQNGYVKFGGSYVFVSSEVGGSQDSSGDGNYRGGFFANRFFQIFGERSGAHIAGRGGGGRGRGKGGGGGGGGNKPKEEEQDKSQVDNITQRASTG